VVIFRTSWSVTAPVSSPVSTVTPGSLTVGGPFPRRATPPSRRMRPPWYLHTAYASTSVRTIIPAAIPAIRPIFMPSDAENPDPPSYGTAFSRGRSCSSSSRKTDASLGGSWMVSSGDGAGCGVVERVVDDSSGVDGPAALAAAVEELRLTSAASSSTLDPDAESQSSSSLSSLQGPLAGTCQTSRSVGNVTAGDADVGLFMHTGRQTDIHTDRHTLIYKAPKS